MKNFIIIISLILVINVYSQSIYDTYSGFTTPVIPVLPSIEKHPQLFFDSTQITEIRNRATINSYYSNLWNKIITNINYYKTKTASSQNVNNRPRMAKYCAFGWIMNNDTVSLNKAKEALLIAYDNVPRTTTAADFSDIYDEIYRATWLQNYCEAYDWVQKWLSATEDSIIRTKITTEVRILRNHMVDSTRYAPRPHNHRSKPAYAIGTAALTFSSDSRASDWLQFALTQLNTVTKYQFSYDGIYREGGHYHLYSMVNGIPFLWHYKNVSGVDLFPYYKPAFEWPVKVRMGQGWIPHFEDSYLKPFPGHLVARAYTNTPTDLHPTATLGSILQWSYFNSNVFNVNYTGATNDVCWDIDEYLLYDNTIVSVMPSVNPVINMGGGQTIFRKSWNYNDRSNRYLVFHGVAEADNHNHPDQLSFVIEAENSLMATAPGYGPAGASDPRRNTWYLTPQSHNLITVDGAPPIDSSVNITPKNIHFLNSEFFSYVEKEAFYTNSARWKRGISFLNKNYWIVRDLVRSSTPKNSVWYLHSRGTLSTNGINAQWTTISDKYGVKALFNTYNISSSGNPLSVANGWLSLWWGEEEIAPYISIQSQDTVSMFLSVLYPHQFGTPAPNVSSTIGYYALSLTVNLSDTTDIHIFKKDNQIQTVNNVGTNGVYVTLSSISNKLKYFGVTECSTLSYNGKNIFTSSQPITFAVMFLNDKVIAEMETLALPTNINLHLPYLASQLNEVVLNNKPIEYTIIGDSVISFSTVTPNIIVSLQSGNWNSTSTWSSGIIPQSNDDVLISNSHVVVVNTQTAVCNNLTINGSLEFSNADSTKLIIYGNLLVNSGGAFKTRSVSSGPLYHRITIKGNLTSLGTFDMRVGSSANVGVGEITFDGYTNSIINLNSGHDLNSVIINKQSDAKVILLSNVEQNNNSTVAPSILYLINGVIETGQYSWHVRSTSSAAGVIGGSSTSYVNGTLVRYIPSGSNLSRTYPVGDDFGYRPITINILSGVSNSPISVKVVHENANSGHSNFIGNIDKVSAVRYYEIKNLSASEFSLTSLKLSYGLDDGVAEGNTELRIAASVNNRNTWMGIGPDPAGNRSHITNLSNPPTIFQSDTIAPNLSLTVGQIIYTAIARQAGTINNSLEPPYLKSTIQGTKYFDIDADSSIVGDSVLEGWVFKLYKDSNLIQTAVSDENGDYMFSNIEPGIYTIEESLKTNWIQTFPKLNDENVTEITYGNNAGPRAYLINVVPGSQLSGFNFANYYREEALCNKLLVRTGWNMISIPFKVNIPTIDILFPNAISKAYYFENGYLPTDTLNCGMGYWVKFSSNDTVQICGQRVSKDTINVKKGWNIIGVFESNISTSNVISVPENNISSPFYGFDGGYFTTSLLEIGKSYWVKVKENGFLILQNSINNKNQKGVIK